MTQTMSERDITEPMSSERVRTTYLEQQMQDMSSVRLHLMEEESCASTDLIGRIQAFCKDQKKKKKQQWESHKMALDVMKASKGKHPKQPSKEEREVVYSQIA